MFFEKELKFLCDTFKKCHVKVSVVSPTDSINSIIDVDLNGIFGRHFQNGTTVHKVIGVIEPHTIYKRLGAFLMCYRYLLLPTSDMPKILFIGPYLTAPISDRALLELTEKYKIPPKDHRYLKEYYDSIPVLSDGCQLFTMLNTFCETVWESPSFSIVDTNSNELQPASPINEPSNSDSFDDIIINMKAMERRYSFENELMEAVSLGQIHKEAAFLNASNENVFEKRTSDPIRNMKNYCIIMNTLLRKAAERGGVHPVYINRVSSSFAIKIEQIQSLSDGNELMREMFRSYCRLVRKHSLKNYSLVVQKTILLIDSDLAADLSLSTLAASQNVSPGYLSTIFRRETGKTVSNYIRDKRIKHAAHLLATTKLQIQTVALHCGIVDVQYFSKIFKKLTGKTPKEYRESLK